MDSIQLQIETGNDLIAQVLAEGFAPETDYTVTQWADAHRYLPKKSSSEPGKYRSSRVPYAREIMDGLSTYSSVQDIVVMKATQLGFTEVGNNWLGYVADVSPGPMAMIFPNDELAKDHSRQKLAPTIEDTPRLKRKISPSKSRTSTNTILTKDFPGGILFLSGANSPANYRSKSIRYLFLDDIDGFPANAGDEGDPIDLAKKRTDTFSARKKIYQVSTPTVKGLSRVEKLFGESDQRYYYVPCPRCGELQRLKWGGVGAEFGIKFKRDKAGRITDIWYECEHCHKRIDEGHKTEMLDNGVWIPKYPGRKMRGYHLSSLYSPLGWVSWLQIAEEFLAAKGDPQKWQVWTNTRMAETYEEEGSQPDWAVLKGRSSAYGTLTVPQGGLFLTAGVDVQENRLAIIIRAWGRDEESWLVYWGEIFGDPQQLTSPVWKELDNFLAYPFEHSSGVSLYIESAGIDSGYHTQTVYNYCRNRPVKTMAIKGNPHPGRPIVGAPTKNDVTWQGEKIKDGIQVWPIGTDTAKATIYTRLKSGGTGPGRYHWPIGIEDEYFIQLTAERYVSRFVKGFQKREWVKIRPRNEALDCEVYAYAAAIRAGMARVNWDALEKSFESRAVGAIKEKPKPKKKPKKQGRGARW